MNTVASPGNNDNQMNETNSVIAKGAFGISSVSAGTVASFLPHIEAWLRITSLCVGIAVGVVTIYSILRKKKQ